MRTTEDLIEQCAAAVHFCRDDADAHEIANAVLAIACPAILEEAAAEIANSPYGMARHELSRRVRALAHTTGQEGGR